MNIFILHPSAGAAAGMLTDRHINKMLIESGQILSTAIQMAACETDTELFKITHTHHPCVKWAMETTENFCWLMDHYDALYYKFQWIYRKDPFDRPHQAYRIRARLEWWLRTDLLPYAGMTLPPLCMPDEYKTDCADINDVVECYRRYYASEKVKPDSYRRNKPPYWLTLNVEPANEWGDLDALYPQTEETQS